MILDSGRRESSRANWLLDLGLLAIGMIPQHRIEGFGQYNASRMGDVTHAPPQSRASCSVIGS